MEAIKTTTNRIHPLMAAAAASVIIVSLAGTAAITGVLPSSNSAPSPQAAAMMTSQNGYGPAYPGAPAPVAVSNAYGQPVVQPVAQPVQGAYAQPVSAMYAQPVAAAVQPAAAPVVIKETIIREVPAKPAPRPRVVHTRYVQHDAPTYYTQARPTPQPNYIGIGTGAVIGGLIGNQVGGGNGKKLATVAGIIGGGMLGNQMINTNR
jgi:uncharacterized protein YcfJ